MSDYILLDVTNVTKFMKRYQLLRQKKKKGERENRDLSEKKKNQLILVLLCFSDDILFLCIHGGTP